MQSRRGLSYAWLSALVILIFALSLVLAFVSGLISAPYFTETAWATEEPAQLSQNISEDDILNVYGNALTKIYDQVVPSVIKLNIVRSNSDTEEITRIGSGFVWDSAGHIVTNYHLVSKAEQITVTFFDGTTVEADVVDFHPLADLAVLKVEQVPEKLQPAILGDGAELQVGQLTLAIGAPFDQDFTMTQGIISAVGRTVRTCEGCYPISGAIQTDAPINPGNSGGPLFNQRGEVIGINTLAITKTDSNSGVNFAISVELIKQIVPELINSNG